MGRLALTLPRTSFCSLLNTQPMVTQTHKQMHTYTTRIRGTGWSTAYCKHELHRPGYIFSRGNKISEAPLRQENTPVTQMPQLPALNLNESGDLVASTKSPSVLLNAADSMLKLGMDMRHVTCI